MSAPKVAEPPNPKLVEALAYQLFVKFGRAAMPGDQPVREDPSDMDRPTQWRNDRALRAWWRATVCELIDKLDNAGAKLSVGRASRLDNYVQTIAIQPSRQVYKLVDDVA